MWASSPAHAAGCTNTWTNTAGGSWATASNWSKGTVPSSSDEVCITTNGTYTVVLEPSAGTSVTVKALTIGGTSGSETLAVTSTCSGAMLLKATEGLTIKALGALRLSSSMCASSTTLAGKVTNNGTITGETGAGGERVIEGNLTNKGTLALNAPTKISGSTLTNEAAIKLAEGVQLEVQKPDAFVEGAGGSIAAPAKATITIVEGSFTQNSRAAMVSS